ncbi:MAG TPA: metallophosphoesterase family protein [Acidobacteriota bacterium]|jgi:diadenosine tetraphosphatase ApaH/serine/threonine PP2A family protein phosphatase
MRYFVIADIHSNLEALDAVLKYRNYDRLLVLGDIVGYGADPDKTVQRIRDSAPAAIVRGNHDKVIAGLEGSESFVSHARESARWTRDQLSPENLDFIRNLPAGPLQIDETITIAHGAPFDEDAYLVPNIPTDEVFEGCTTPVCFFGHTHVPTVFYGIGQTVYSTQVIPPVSMSLMRDASRYLINPGSVGQPRDGDPRAAFLVFDSEKFEVEFHRVEYDIQMAQQKIRAAGLPDFLSQRLARGV